MTLVIVRHAIAMEQSDFALSGLEDRYRPLTTEGARKMRKNAKGVAVAMGRARPDRLFTSPWARARSTADILAARAWPGLSVEERDELAGDRALPEALGLIRLASDAGAKAVCLVGHEPHLSHLIGWLLVGAQGAAIALRKGGAACLSFDRELEPSSASLEWLLAPRLLRSLA